uniref:class I adenylate-forming enzyme family protein n=1 Tax=Microbispora cellulosiformans TaxID=2614688 RepID=UPI0029813CEB|nr:class I adenylate-forming enzyme family protein [Microbispora cellulosiformans]
MVAADGTEPAGGPPATRSTVPAVLRRLGSTDPAQPALTWYRGGERGGSWSRGRLLTAIRDRQAWLRAALDLAPGDRVVLHSTNRPEFVATALAVMAAGAIVVPVPPDESTARIRYITAHSEAKAVLSESGGDFGAPHHLLDLDPAPEAGHREPPEWDVVPPDAPAVLLYTSGTTGSPKGVTLSHRNLMVNAEGLRRAHDIRERSSHVCVLPLHHANAFGFSMISTLYAGGHLVLNDSFPLLAIRRIINDERADVISVVPQILQLWLRRPVRSEDVPSLRFVVSAAAPLSVDLARRFHAVTGLRIHQGYGLSECTNFATCIAHDIAASEYDQAMHAEPVPSIGTELFGCRCDVVDAAGNSLPEGVTGEIAVSGGNVMSGYWRDSATTAVALPDGRLRTGDQGYWRTLSGRRYFFITGRIKELIIRAGTNVSPREVEDELELPYDHAVVGFPHEAVGEEVGLYVAETLPRHAQSTLCEALKEVPFFRRPKVVVFGGGSVPRTATGKVRRGVLVAHFTPYREMVVLDKEPIFASAGSAHLEEAGDSDG